MPTRLLDRYLLRETLAAFTAVLLVLLLIMLSTRFARLLSDAASGDIPQTLLARAVGLSVLQYLVLLMPVAQLLAVMLTLGRMYRDNEIAAMLGCGVRLSSLYRPFMLCAVLVSAASAWLSFGLGPWAGRTSEALIRDARRLVQYTPFEAGRFNSVAGGRAVFYTAEMNADSSQLGMVFAEIEESEGASVVIARSGQQTMDSDSGDRSIELQDGWRYAGTPGAADWEVVRFQRFSIRVTPPEFLYSPGKRQVMETGALLVSEQLADRAELHWRASAPLAVLLLTLLAVPLAHVRPRSGRYAKLVLGLVVYLVYANLLGVGQDWITKGRVPAVLGLWWVHALLGGGALWLLAVRDGWLQRWRSSGVPA